MGEGLRQTRGGDHILARLLGYLSLASLIYRMRMGSSFLGMGEESRTQFMCLI